MSREGRIERLEGRADTGFGLIEVIIAMVILTVGVLSVSSVLTQSIAMQTLGAQRESALSIAQTEMEQIRATEPLLIVPVAAVAVNESAVPTTVGLFSRHVTVTNVSGNINEVTVIVTAPRVRPVRLVVWIYDGST